MAPEIVTIAQKRDEKFLRKKTVPFDFKKFTRKEINDLIMRMQRAMHAANGIGLSANQIGLTFSVFVAEVPDAQGGTKFYAVFNPKIEKSSKELITFEEGCLSVPGKWGDVTRSEQIIVSGYNKMGKPVKVKAWGLLSRVFQHEIDHLNGKLFIDRAKSVHESEQTSE
ncbi:MAG TPA: peptide deformylase [Candidatus Paceibacterota bacterium]|nr:peptide deformylase [Candidatus Paceibacterota bacterium]